MTADSDSRSVLSLGLEPGTECGLSKNEPFPFAASARDRTGDCKLTDQDPQKLLSPCEHSVYNKFLSGIRSSEAEFWAAKPKLQVRICFMPTKIFSTLQDRELCLQ